MQTRRAFASMVVSGAAGLGCGTTLGLAGDLTLRQIIEREIRAHVRESWGELDGENFTEVNLEQFHHDDVPAKIVRSLRTDPAFLRAMEKVKAMPPAQRSAYLAECRKPLRPTWAEQGAINRKGTTEAGRVAETEIAAAITDLAQSLL